MKDSGCEMLEDFLDGVLPSEEQSLFAEHCSRCEVCREAVAFERTLKAAAEAEANAIVAPAEISDGTRRLIRKRQTQTQVAWSCAIALGVGICGFGFYRLYVDAGAEARPEIVQNDVIDRQLQSEGTDTIADQPPAIASQIANVEVRTSAGEPPRHIAVSRPTQDPEVTLVMVYHTFRSTKPAGVDADIQRP